MPPRFAYWTILIDNAPTAFRARDPQELLPTLNQLKRTNPNIVMKWFSGGTLWDSPEAARDARRRAAPPREKRSADWRPGGAHKDPRDRFKGKERRKPWHGKPAGRPQGQRPWRPKASGDQSRPWRDKPGAPPRGEKQWGSKPSSGSGRSSGSGGSSRSSGSGGSGARPWSAKPPGGDRRPFGSAQGKPFGPAQGGPWKKRPNDDRRRKRRDDEPDR